MHPYVNVLGCSSLDDALACQVVVQHLKRGFFFFFSGAVISKRQNRTVNFHRSLYTDTRERVQYPADVSHSEQLVTCRHYVWDLCSLQ